MSHLQYYTYPGYGEESQRNLHYSQAVRIGDRIECSGQGGWNPTTSRVPSDINAQIDQAFSNVELALQRAGGKGWSQVFRINSYHVPLNEEAMNAMVRNLRKSVPGHQPIWTCVGVARLAFDDMRVEIEVVAHDPNE
ncbi:YjgF-like protein [Aspergillus ellipticus CBS 707.79]|uniref:YjgF-like protein n=1 Tax=Aspergillus ellipticus CBS 707.79 TaxID=1448320 RepID=A0A319DL98_9EURO|nr:YjgF-like protein [Aspergillus ellipticus CBS 707.79]